MKGKNLGQKFLNLSEDDLHHMQGTGVSPLLPHGSQAESEGLG
jgi:hypothetical protein